MWSNPRRIAGLVAGLFFPQREALGLDSRGFTPELVRVTMHVAAETRSYQRAATLMQRALDASISPKTVERLVGQLGEELRQQQESPTSAKQVTTRSGRRTFRRSLRSSISSTR
jgi:hypothetical protein